MTEPSEDAGMCIATVGCRRHAVIGYLCRGHVERVGAILREIEDEACLLSAVPSLQQRNGRSGSLASQRVPARLDVLVHNDPRHGTGKSEDETDELAAGQTLSVLATLHSWARAVREDDQRKLSAPERVTISGERDLLVRQLPWIAEQPWVDEFYSDLSTLLGQLRTANYHRPERPLTRCVVPTEDGLCGGHVWLLDVMQPAWTVLVDRCERRYIEVPDGPAVCDTCGATWSTPEDKARLKLMIEQTHDERTRPRTEDGERMLTVPELAEYLGKSVNAVRIVLSRERIVGVGGYYDPALFVKVSA